MMARQGGSSRLPNELVQVFLLFLFCGGQPSSQSPLTGTPGRVVAMLRAPQLKGLLVIVEPLWTSSRHRAWATVQLMLPVIANAFRRPSLC
jgi:hypothetical protein